MTVEEQIYSVLTANATLTSLLGGRIYAVQLKQKATYPAMVYQRISTAPYYSHSGGQWAWSRFQFTIWADGANGILTALQIGQALTTAMQSFNTSPHTGLVQAAMLMQQRASIEPQTPQPLGKCICDFKVIYNSLT